MALTTTVLLTAAAFVYGVLSDNNCPISEKSIYEPSVFQKCIYNSRNEKTTYNNSEMFCRAANGFLLKINNAYENSLAVTILYEENGNSGQNVRLGLRRTNDVWRWDDGSSPTYLHFAPDHPKAGMNCASLNTSDLLWYSTDCQVPSSFSCLFPRLNNPTNPAPANCGKCLPGWNYFAETNMCYFVGHDANYTEAENVCALLGTNLTSIHSLSENNFILGLTLAKADSPCSYSAYSTWIGGYYSDQWRWSDGTAFDYNNIYGPDTQNYGNLALIPTSSCSYFGQWTNINSFYQLPYFVCKTPASL